MIVEGRNRGVVKATGQAYEHDWVMVFTLKEDKISRYWQYYDTVDVATAFRSE